MSGSLFVFAHRGEAGAFLKDRDWEPVPFFFSGLYRSSQEGILLLITGEGGQNVSERLSAVLSHFESIRLVVNLGIAGALDERGLKQGEIHSVRTVYRYVGDQPVFRSFTTSDTGAGVDCISSDVRVLEYGLVEKLLPFAPIVDREAWFIGSVAQLYRKEFQIYKLISDYAGKEDQCLEIRDRAPEYSRSLHRFFKVSFPVPERKNQREKTEFPSALYVTVTQRRRLAKLLEVLTSRTGRLPASIWGEPSVKAILKGDTSSKRKTAMVIKWLEEWVNPFTCRFERALANLSRELGKKGIRVSYDSRREELQFQFSAAGEKDFYRKMDALSTLDANRISHLLDGKDIDKKK